MHVNRFLAAGVGPLSFVVFLFLALSADAGFSSRRVNRIKIGPGKSTAKLDKMAIDKKIGPTSLAQMKRYPLYRNLTDDEIQEKVKWMRKGIICSIILIKKENREIGEALEKLWLSDGICIGLAPRSYRAIAEIRPNNKAEFTINEKINIYTPMCQDTTLTNFDLFQLFDTLSHEGLHGAQDVNFSQTPNLTQAKDIHCKEIDAHQGMVDRLTRMKAALDGIKADGKVPKETTGAIKDFADAIAKGPMTAEIVADWLKKVKKELQKQKNLVEFRTIHKKAACLFLEGKAVVKPTQAQLKKFRVWFDYYKNQGREWSPIAPLFVSYAPQLEEKIGADVPEITGRPQFAMIHSDDSLTRDYTVPGVDTISDGLIVGQDSPTPRLVVGGTNLTTNEGVIVAFDINTDTGAIASEMPREWIRTEMTSGFTLGEHPDGDLYVLDRSTGELFRADDTNNDQVPDTLMPDGFVPVNPGGEMFQVPQDFFFSDDGMVVFTDRFESGAIAPWGSEQGVSTRRTPDDTFSEPLVDLTGIDGETDPTVTGLPYVGLDRLEIGGSPGTDATVWFRSPGEEPRIVGSAPISWCGTNSVPLSAPINERDTIIISDSSGQASAEFFCIPRPSTLPKVDLQFTPGGHVQIRSQTFPGDRIRLYEQNLTTGESTQTNQFFANNLGTAYFSQDPLTTENSFIVLEGEAPGVIPVAAPDSFIVTPGITSHVNVASNDPHVPPGTWFQLTTAPEFPYSVFQWTDDGKITVSMPTFSGPIEFEYRPVRRGITGKPVRGVFEPTGEDLKNPVPYDGPGGVPWVCVPALSSVDGMGSQEHFLFPLYQFTFAFSLFDNCKIPHWHWRFGIPVYALNDPDLLPIDDPLPDDCGHGSFFEVFYEPAYVPQEFYDLFLELFP